MKLNTQLAIGAKLSNYFIELPKNIDIEIVCTSDDFTTISLSFARVKNAMIDTALFHFITVSPFKRVLFMF